jgi:predicted transcriptional regulator
MNSEISLVPNSQIDNPRADTSHKKYQKQIEWRRNKVKELLIRGYSQYEISNSLHISQPTISRDINSIYQDKKKRQQKYGDELFLDVQNTLAGLAELIKKSWTFVDDPKAEQKERMKAISIILQCYGKRLDLLNLEPEVNGLKEYIDSVKKAEREITRKEKALQAYLEGRKLTQHEIDLETSPEAKF